MLASKTASLCLLLGLTMASMLLVAAVPLPRRDIPPRCVSAGAVSVDCAAAGADSLLPHPADCQLFLYCVAGETQPVCRQCPAGLHFSPAEHVCAAPDVAGCNSTLTPTTTGTTPTEYTSPTTGYPTTTITTRGTTPTWATSTTTMETTLVTSPTTTSVPWTTIF